MRDLVFGTQCDGRSWPEFAGAGEAALGSAVVGPRGLVEAVETALGTRGPPASAVRRIALMQAKLVAVAGPRFWSRSLTADPWSTARLVLAWRDELVLAGWDRKAGAAPSRRILDLAEAEGSGPDLPPGFEDRCARAASDLRAAPSLPWRSLALAEPRELLDPGMKRLVAAIAAAGVEVRASPASEFAGGDLGRVQRLLAGHPPEALAGDGSLLVVHADTETMAADALASWLDAAPPAQRAGTVFMLGAPTGLLDAALAQRGLPRFAHSLASPARTALQVLRLAFETRWEPFDPVALLELLQLPRGPVPGAVASLLARTLAEVPGRGSQKWTEALQQCVNIRREHFEKQDLQGQELAQKLRQDTDAWRTWVESTAHEPIRGMPADEAVRTCSMVAGWAARSGSDDPLRMRAAGAASDLADAVRHLGTPFVPRMLLSRMIDEAIGPGASDPAAVAEAAKWSAVTSPGAIWSRAETVVWWAPAGAVAPRGGPWTLAEVEALAGGDCHLHDSAQGLAAASRTWRQPVMHAGQRLVLVLSRTLHGGEVDQHPLMHELAALLDHAPAGVRLRAEDLLHGTAAFGGHPVVRSPVAARQIAVPARWWPGTIAVPRPSRASATSIEKLLGCRLAWTLEYAARLGRGSRASIPAGDRLVGLLAHAVVRDVLLPGNPPSPDAARARAQVALEGLLHSEAAPLMLPGSANDLARAKRLIPEAVAHLAETLAEAGLRVLGTEVEARADPAFLLDDAVLSGRFDLMLEDDRNRRVVLDMKWSGHDGYRRNELKEGRAIQLATYGRLQPSGVPATAAYFMLAQSQMLAAESWPFAGAHVQGRSLSDTWQEIEVGWQAALGSLAAGKIDAPGAGEGNANHPCALVVEAPCKFCGYGVICGKEAVT